MALLLSATSTGFAERVFFEISQLISGREGRDEILWKISVCVILYLSLKCVLNVCIFSSVSVVSIPFSLVFRVRYCSIWNDYSNTVLRAFEFTFVDIEIKFLVCSNFSLSFLIASFNCCF